MSTSGYLCPGSWCFPEHPLLRWSTYPIPFSLKKLSFRASFRIVNPDGKDSLLRLEGMRFVLTVPVNVQGNTMNLDINTDVDIPRGQQVVVGKASYKDRAFILVMNARFD